MLSDIDFLDRYHKAFDRAKSFGMSVLRTDSGFILSRDITNRPGSVFEYPKIETLRELEARLDFIHESGGKKIVEYFCQPPMKD